MFDLKTIKKVIRSTDSLMVLPRPKKAQAVITYKDDNFLLKFHVQYSDDTAMYHAFKENNVSEWLHVCENRIKQTFKLK